MDGFELAEAAGSAGIFRFMSFTLHSWLCEYVIDGISPEGFTPPKPLLNSYPTLPYPTPSPAPSPPSLSPQPHS